MVSKTFALIALPILLVAKLASAEDKKTEENAYDSLAFRSIGPAFFSGRISDFAVLPGGGHAYYAATASGGLWLTTNNGTTWAPIFDGEKSYALGVVELDPKDPRTVWVDLRLVTISADEHRPIFVEDPLVVGGSRRSAGRVVVLGP
ncbi:MAG: hypothetical protein AAFZ18_38295, partial [Myxococcota bacterium]